MSFYKLCLLATIVTYQSCHGFTTKPLVALSTKHFPSEVHIAPPVASLRPPMIKPCTQMSLEDNTQETNTMDVMASKNKTTHTPKKDTTTIDQNLHKKLTVPLVTILLMLTTMLTNPLRTNAVPSGGRVGGSFGGGSSRSSSTRMYSSPSTYNRGYSQGYSSGYYARPNIVVNPFYAPRPFFSPFGWSPGYYSPGVTVVSRGPNLFSLFGLGGMLLCSAFVWNSMSNNLLDFGGNTQTALSTDSALGKGVSVVKLSIAMTVPKRDDSNSILSVLDRLSSQARTDSRVGVSNLMSQVSLELLRRKDSIVAASSSYTHVKDAIKAQREFNALSVTERSKFEKETVSKYGGVDYNPKIPTTTTTSQNEPQATMAVITLLLNIDGDSTRLPPMNSIRDVSSALTRIASDVKVGECLRSAEILWTPEQRSDTLVMRDVLSDYPDLRTV